jgi:chromosome segregation ATPase
MAGSRRRTCSPTPTFGTEFRAMSSEATTDRLDEIQAQLASILEARISELDTALRDSESMTRRLVGAEIELDRHRATKQRLSAELDGILAEAKDAGAAASELQDRHAAAIRERADGREATARLEVEVRTLDADVEQSRARSRALESEHDELRSENASLKTKLKTLEENITRMQRLKDELMSSISGLTAQMSGIAGGSEQA